MDTVKKVYDKWEEERWSLPKALRAAYCAEHGKHELGDVHIGVSCFVVVSSGGFRGGAGGPWRGGGMVSAQYLRGARRGGNLFPPPPVGQKFWARGK